MPSSSLKTACHSWHVEHQGRMVDFAGWDMPVQYSTIVEEHQAVRTAAGLFDIAHMGRLKFTGDDAGRFLGHVTTINAETLAVGQVKYALVVNDAGGILDDILVYRFDDHYLMVVNASNRLKILGWIEERRNGHDVRIEDLTFGWSMLALQGPNALEILKPLAGHDISEIAYYYACEGTVLNVPAVFSRTGYTGEDGFEVIIPSDHALRLWDTLMERGGPLGIKPCGLGCRDTLRLEAAMPLYGHEMNESTDPFTAGLAFGVQLDGREFIGRQALEAAKATPDRPKRVGLELAGKRIAREQTPILMDGKEVGKVTSGTFSPTLQKSIAMGYVPASIAGPGQSLALSIRGSEEVATVVRLPFYKRKK